MRLLAKQGVKEITKLHFEFSDKEGQCFCVKHLVRVQVKLFLVLKRGIKPADLIASTPPIALNSGGLTHPGISTL